MTGSAGDRWALTLYVDGASPGSITAIETICQIRDEDLGASADLEIIDVRQQPALAERDQVVVVPTLVRRHPSPPRRIVGNLHDDARLRRAIDLEPAPAAKNGRRRTHAQSQRSEAMTRLPAVRPAGPGILAIRPRDDSRADTTELRAQLHEATETLEAIRTGRVDSLVIGLPGQEQIYAVATADRPYRLIVESMTEGAATVSPRGVILDANPRLRAMTGRPASELVGMAVLDLVTGFDCAEFARLLDVEAGDSARGEAELVQPDGPAIPVALAVSGFEFDGMLLRSLVLTDLGAQHAAEARIRAAGAYTRSLIEANLNTMFVIGADGKITDVNNATELATGIGRAELVGTEFYGYFTDPDRASSGCQRAFIDGTMYDCLLELRHVDGQVTPILFNASAFLDPSGQVAGIMAAGRDVTQIRRAEAAMRESEGRLRAIFETAPVGIDDLSLSGQIIAANLRISEFTGYSIDELRALTVGDLTHPDDAVADKADFKRLVSGEIDNYSLQMRYLHKDGSVAWAEASRALVRDQDGRPLQVIGIVRDITEQRRAEAEVRALNADLETRVGQRTAELERANHNLEAFSYSISHDLRAPLRALHGFSEALVEEFSDRLDEVGQGYVTRIQAASVRMAALIDDLLLLSRVSRAEVTPRPVNLSVDVAEIADDLRSVEPDRQVRFSIQDEVWVSADRDLIRSVVQNLLSNAWKFTAKRDDAVVEFGATPAGDDQLCCYVRDNGAGFDPEYAGKLFQPFQRLHLASEFPGNGIGLASVRQIVERHGGRTWADGAIGAGATFFFTLTASKQP